MRLGTGIGGKSERRQPKLAAFATPFATQPCRFARPTDFNTLIQLVSPSGFEPETY